MTKGKTLSSKLLLATGIISAITGLIKTVSDIVLAVVDRVAPRPIAMPEKSISGLETIVGKHMDNSFDFAQLFSDYLGVGLLFLSIVILFSYIIINRNVNE